MAIYYIDPINGDSGNDGSSWANAVTRYDDLTSVSAGDEIRFPETPKRNIGNISWTDDAYYAEIAGSQAQGIWDASLPLIAVNGGTKFTNTNAYTVKDKSYVVYNSTDNQQIGYMALNSPYAAEDLSDFDTLEIAIRPAGICSDGAIQIKLCSDNIGAVPVNSFDVPAIAYANQWYYFSIPYGSSLGSSISSIGIYLSSSSGLTNKHIYIGNVFVSKSTGGIHLTDALGKDDGKWYGVGGVDKDGKIYLTNRLAERIRNDNLSIPTTTETVTSYSYTPIYIGTLTNTLDDDFPCDSNVEIVGGYNTSTNTRDGITVLSSSYATNCFNITGNGYSLNYLSGSFFYYFCDISGANISLDNCDFLTASYVRAYEDTGYNNTANINMITNAGNPVYITGSNAICEIGGIINTTSNIQFSPYGTSRLDVTGDCANIFTSYALIIDNGAMVDFNGNDLDCTTTAASVSARSGTLANCNIIQNGTPSYGELYMSQPYKFRTKNVQVSYATEVSIAKPGGVIFAEDYDGVVGTHKILTYYGVFSQDTTIKHGTNDWAWKYNITDANSPNNTGDLKIADVYVVADKEVTISAWVRKDTSTIATGIHMPKTLPGQTATTALMTGDADTWEQVTITITPTVSGLVKVYFVGGCALGNCWIDDLTIEQAE